MDQTKEESVARREDSGLPFRSMEDAREALLAKIGLDEAGKVRLGTAFVEALTSELGATETKFFAHEGRVVDEREVKAHGPILKALDLVAETLGLKAPRARAPEVQINIRYKRPAYRNVDHTPVGDAIDVPVSPASHETT